MNITDAAYAVVHDYPGGSESLAPRLGLSGAMLRNKVNPNNDTHKLSLAEAARIADVTNDDRILEAWARERGYALVEIPSPENCSDGEIIELMAKTWETNGDIGKEIIRTFEDGRVEKHEVLRVKERTWKHFQMLLGLVSRIEGMAEEQ
ncbi:phage regulatory CII family protein [Burkholderia multivorans]|uniref:phage regulatory CII family protein n=1 Tax=Burkholderia multivorans TaxID=87883 RepID=UPI001C248BA6|nr:phage regulatory CII family protein [Burkholderia multivorans]MBU9403541.1 phage regulatory CII family protein [Burkholderia multivorans]UQN71761.1 phage regulatory CII family protein [Burkholderia multivorans]UQN77497.1 phage regulatory CII family protein [Burkholderia multivorans]